MNHGKKMVLSIALLQCLSLASPARATTFNDLFVFGDSFSDTGAYIPLSNGSTSVGYLAQDLGITLVTSRDGNPGTNGVNFAEGGSRIDTGPQAPAMQPRSLTQQVAEFSGYVSSGAVTFNPATSLFLLLGGLNDHTYATPAQVSEATSNQVATLHSLGARYIEIGILPSLISPFADSAANINPAYRDLVPLLQEQYPDSRIQLSGWGGYYDDILRNPATYGITDTVDPCHDGATQDCPDPGNHFYYYYAHPSARSHGIVGGRLYQEAIAIQAVPEPTTISLLGIAVPVAYAIRRRRPGRTRSGIPRATPGDRSYLMAPIRLH